MKSHPTLKTKDGDMLDVWVIDNADELDKQIKAIRSGK